MLVACCLAAFSAPPALAVEITVEDHVFAPGSGIPESYSHFAQILGTAREQGATEAFRCLAKLFPELAFGVFKIPRPLIDRPRFPFVIAVASYATESEAIATLGLARDIVRYPALWDCLGISGGQGSSIREINTTFSLRSGQSQWPSAILRTPIAPFNGIGYRRTATNEEVVRAVVAIYTTASTSDIASLIAHYKSLYPDIAFSAISQGRAYYLTVAAFADDQTLRSAILHMRRRGLYELTYSAEVPSSFSQSSIQSPITAVDILGKPVSMPVPQFDEKIVTLPVYTIRHEDLIEDLPTRVKRCINKDEIRFDELASCSGVILSDTTLMRCLLDSDCLGVRVPIGFKTDPVTMVKQCLSGTQNACNGTTIDAPFATLLESAGFSSCLDDLGSDNCNIAREKLSMDCDPNTQEEPCKSHADKVRKITDRVQALDRCLKSGICDGVVPRVPDVEKIVLDEAHRIGTTVNGYLSAAQDGIAFLREAESQMAGRFKECIELRRQGKSQDAEGCFVNLALSGQEREVLNCVSTKRDQPDELIGCITASNPELTQDIERAKCARDAGSDYLRVATCFGGADDAQRLKAAVECAQASSNDLSAGINCVSGIPEDLKSTLSCILGGSDCEDLIGNLPNLGGAQRLSTCLAEASTDRERMNCVMQNVNIDPQVKATLGCLANANSDVSMVIACAASQHVPPEVARATVCAASSTGVTDFALCAVAPKMNEEARIAAECAVSTGGEPLSFASCTAGRLTVRELTKCLQGEFGKDGGCFGPNNDFVKALKTIANDLLHGPGQNNDIVRFLNNFASAVEDLGRAVGDLLKGVGDAFRNFVCGIFRC
jgi:hypothetical protein